MTRICRLIGFALAVTGALSAFAADTYPNRPVRLIVPYPAGGPNDVLARMVGGKLNDAWKEQVVIDNRPGASGIVGSQIIAKATPDGYNLLMVFPSHEWLLTSVP